MPLTLSKKDDNIPATGLRVAYISWNMANNPPTPKDIDTILAAQDGEVDAVIISAQEETRNKSKTLGRQLQKKLTAKKGRSAYFDTWTTGPGRVSHTVLSNHDIAVANKGRYEHAAKRYKFKNKGGLHAEFTINGYGFHSVAVHLDSKDPVARLLETEALMRQVEGVVSDYDQLSRKAAPVVFGGDLNCRNQVGKKTVSRPFLTAQGLTVAEPDGGPTYAGKLGSRIGSHNAPDPNRPGEKIGGNLDLVSARGIIGKIRSSVIDLKGNITKKGKPTSDHQPVVAMLDVPKYADDFECTKAFVADIAAGIAAGIAEKSPEAAAPTPSHGKAIHSLTGSDTDKVLLVEIYNHCQHTKKNLIEAKKLELEEHKAKTKPKPKWKIFTSKKKWKAQQTAKAKVYSDKEKSHIGKARESSTLLVACIDKIPKPDEPKAEASPMLTPANSPPTEVVKPVRNDSELSIDSDDSGAPSTVAQGISTPVSPQALFGDDKVTAKKRLESDNAANTETETHDENQKFEKTNGH